MGVIEVDNDTAVEPKKFDLEMDTIPTGRVLGVNYAKRTAEEIQKLKPFILASEVPSPEGLLCLDFSFVNRPYDTQGSIKSKADFRGRLIMGTKFLKCSLPGASFDHTPILDSVFCEVEMVEARFMEALVVQSKLNGNFLFANFRGCYFKDVILEGNFGGADFTNTVFDNVIFVGNFQRCNFAGARFSKCQGYRMHSSKHANFSNSDFTGSAIHSSDFKSVTFERCTFTDAVFSGYGVFQYAQFNGSDFAKFKFDNGDFEDARFTNCTRLLSAKVNRNRCNFNRAIFGPTILLVSTQSNQNIACGSSKVYTRFVKNTWWRRALLWLVGVREQ